MSIPSHIEVTTSTPSPSEMTSKDLEQQLRMGHHEDMQRLCEPIVELQGRLGEKWSVLVISLLSNSPKRFNDLKRTIGNISQRMLTHTLRSLERDGLVHRRVYPTVPPQVEYSLTELGHSLRVPIQAMTDWAIANHAEIVIAREEFDRSRLEPNPDESGDSR